MSYKTITGRRQDLEAIPVNPPTEYIGNKIYPVVPVMEKTGSVYYTTVTTDAAAQTGRSAGTAPTAVMLSESVTTFSAAEVIKRYGVPKDEVKQMGGIEKADKLGGTASKRSVLRAIETAQATALFSTARYNAASDIGSAIIDGIIAAESILSLTPQAFKAMLQTLFAFQEVLVGDDDHWAISGKLDAAAVVKLPPADEFSHKLGPVLGKTALYLPDGLQPYEIESFYDEDTKSNYYDAQAFYQIKELNTAACKLVKGIGASS